ncbi:exosome complex exonuclease RRP42 isoform X2 [Orussus abietinus]|nr:exosome complex exonuclease RRP42 isoform X2 [Orussus abietinus]
MEIETKILPQCHGSARLKVMNTDILVGVKVEVDTPFAHSPDKGKIEFFVDCSANATPAFEGKGGDDLSGEISTTLAMAYGSEHALDLKKLCILPHHKCWKVYVDVSILQCGGNLFDSVSVAVKGALFSTEIPKVTTMSIDGGEPDIELSDDPYDCVKLDVTGFPVLVTLCKIGENNIIDPNAEEETCSSASTVISVLPNGRITYVAKLGYGSLQPATLIKALQAGKDIGIRLNNALMDILIKEDALGPNRPILGFLR